MDLESLFFMYADSSNTFSISPIPITKRAIMLRVSDYDFKLPERDSPVHPKVRKN